MAVSLERFQTQFQQANDYSRVRGLLLFTSGITVVVGIVFSITALFIAILTNQQGSDFRAVALAGVFACVLGLSQVWSSSLVSFARPAWAAFPGALFSPALAIAIAGVVTWVAGSLGAGALIMILIGTSIIALFGQWVGMLRAFPKGFRSTISPVTTEWRTWVKAGPPVLIMSAMVILLYRLDLFALAVFGTTTEVATYAAAITIAEIIGILPTAGYSGAVPFFAPFFRSGRTDLVQYTVRQYFRLLLVPAIVLTTIIVVFAGPLLGIYGAGSGSYSAGLAPIMILLAGQLISLLLGPAGYLLIMHGRALEVAIIYSCGLVVDIILLVVLVPRFGLVGAATCTLVSMFLAQVTMWWLVRRRLGVDSGFWMFRSKPPANGSSPDVTS
jgi:O-antigen/teichoic acid export membrane protein